MARRAARVLAVAFVLALACSQAAAAPAESLRVQPRLALVLSGGGARGAAHIGVLKVLEQVHVVPDIVVGTSTGSIVGGLYAAGWSPEQIEALLASIDWNVILSDRVARGAKSFRRKQDDRPYLISTKMRFKGRRPYVPPGVLGGQHLELLLRSLEIQSTGEADFDRLPIPFRAVAMDIATGEVVVIDSGSLAVAIRASMSIPGALPPVELEGRSLVDGGGAANLPVGVAQRLGASRIIAVDVSSPFGGPGERFDSFLSTFNQINTILTVSNLVADTQRLNAGDLLIRPDLGDITFVSLERAGEAVAIGEAAARAKLEALRAFAVDDGAWAAFKARHHTRPASELRVDSIRIENTSPVADELVRRALGLEAGRPFEDAAVREALLNLFNLDYFGIMADRLEQLPDGTHELVVTVPPPLHGRNRLQFGLGFSDDFQGDAAYSFALRHQLLAANRRGGEWQNVLQIGDSTYVASEFYQPLDDRMRWFVAPRASFRRVQQSLWRDGKAITEYRFSTEEVRVDAGRVLGNWGELRAGAFVSSSRGENRIGLPAVPDYSEHRGGAEASFHVDTLSSTVFPGRGSELLLRYLRSSDALGSDAEFEQVYLRGLTALSFGDNTLSPLLELGDNLHDVGRILDTFPLGGLGRLSGLGTNEVRGERLLFGSLRYHRRLKNLDMASLRLRLYGGLTVEAGNVYARGEAITSRSLLFGWGAFVGAETPIGPLYLAYGRTERRDRVYLAIGDRF